MTRYTKTMTQALAEVATFVEGYEGNIISHLGELGIDAKFKFRKLLIKRKDMARAKDALKDGIRDRNSIISGHKMPTIIASEYEPDEDEKKKDMKEVDEAVAQKDAFVVTGGPGDNNQKVIGVFKDEKSAKKARDDYNKKNRPAKKSHMARIYKQSRLSQSGKRFKPGEKIGWSTYSNKAQFTKLKEDDADPVKDAEAKADKLKKVAALKKQIMDIQKEDTDLDEASKYLKYSDLLLKKGRMLGKNPNANTKAVDKEIAREMQKLGIKEQVEDLEEFTTSQIARLQKEYEPLRGKETGVNPEKFAKLRKMMKRMKKPQLMALVKANIPILTSAAKASLVVNFGMKWSQLPEELVPYIEVFADDTLEEAPSKFKEVDPKVIDRVELMMRGSREQKNSIANMLNYLMPPEVVDMIRYKLKIVPKRGKIKF